jgi:hypothetical protein
LEELIEYPPSPGSLQAAVMDSIELFVVAAHSREVHLKLLNHMVALEILLCPSRNNKANQLKEGVAQLISTDEREMLYLLNRIPVLYDLRSRYVHNGKREFRYSDVAQLELITLRLIQAIVENHLSLSTTRELRALILGERDTSVSKCKALSSLDLAAYWERTWNSLIEAYATGKLRTAHWLAYQFIGKRFLLLQDLVIKNDVFAPGEHEYIVKAIRGSPDANSPYGWSLWFELERQTEIGFEVEPEYIDFITEQQ